MMKTAALAIALATAMTTASFAQTTGPSGQQDTNKAGMANPNSPSSMSHDKMTNDTRHTGTTGNAMSGPTTPGTNTGPSGQTPKPQSK